MCMLRKTFISAHMQLRFQKLAVRFSVDAKVYHTHPSVSYSRATFHTWYVNSWCALSNFSRWWPDFSDIRSTHGRRHSLYSSKMLLIKKHGIPKIFPFEYTPNVSLCHSTPPRPAPHCSALYRSNGKSCVEASCAQPAPKWFSHRLRQFA